MDSRLTKRIIDISLKCSKIMRGMHLSLDYINVFMKSFSEFIVNLLLDISLFMDVVFASLMVIMSGLPLFRGREPNNVFAYRSITLASFYDSM